MAMNKAEAGLQDGGKSNHQDVSAKTCIGVAIAFGCVLFGGLFCALYAWQAPSLVQSASVLGVAAVLAGAAMLVGALVGFIFGIPRTLQREAAAGAAENPPGQKTQDGQPTISHLPNTNLEQISDWLTKILVGVGLTQLTSIPAGLRSYAAYAAPYLGDFPSSPLFASALLVYFSVCGFLIGYLCTRLYLASAIGRADLDVTLARVQGKVTELERTAQTNAMAVLVAQRVLDPDPSEPPLQQSEINEAICAASDATRAGIFYQARDIRTHNWRDRENKPRMERTIPIFRALITCAPANDASHGQLGYALKDQRQPQWAEAEAELTRAIELRGPWERDDGPAWYEFNRAVCRINLDDAFRHDQKSNEETNKAIVADLEAAAQRDLQTVIQVEDDILCWMQLNGVRMEELGGAPRAPAPRGA
jgi:hypothetical protein